MGTDLALGARPAAATVDTDEPSMALTSAARWAMAVAATVYGAIIWLSPAIVDGRRFWLLTDDAMISMTFARTIADGHGLVWFPGAEPVEGYTNFAWTLWMTLVHLTGLPDRLTSLAVMVTSAGLLLTSGWLAWRLALRLTADRQAATTAMVLVLACYPLAYFSLLGMEVGLIAALTLGAVLLADRLVQQPTVRDGVGLCLLVAVGLLCRTDFALPAGAAIGWLALHRRYRWAGFATATAGVTLAGHTLFRLAYYGATFPNTYYLKMTGQSTPDRVGDGIVAAALAAPAFLVPVVLGVVALAVGRRRRDLAYLLAAVFGLQLAYSVYAGGDSWDPYGFANRFVTVGLPALFVLASAAVPWLRGRLSVPPAMVTATVAVVVSVTALGTVDAPPIRADSTHREMVRYSLDLRDALPAGTSVTVTSAGTVPYFSRLPAVDLLGKIDPVIARGPVHPAADGQPQGHKKWDYGYSIGTVQPDVVTWLWIAANDEACPNLDDWGYHRSGGGFVRDGVDVDVPVFGARHRECPGF